MPHTGDFGFRVVTPGSLIWHGFRRQGGRSLCGRVPFGPDYPSDLKRGRSCKTCAAIWHTRHPKPIA